MTSLSQTKFKIHMFCRARQVNCYAFLFQQEAIERQNKLQEEQQAMAESLKNMQRKLNEEKSILLYVIFSNNCLQSWHMSLISMILQIWQRSRIGCQLHLVCVCFFYCYHFLALTPWMKNWASEIWQFKLCKKFFQFFSFRYFILSNNPSVSFKHPPT